MQLDPNRLSCTLEEFCDRFLKTHNGLHYLLIKYPTLSLLEAIKEYKKREAEVELYC